VAFVGRLLRGFVAFWYDFIVGDDWKIAVAVLAALATGALLITAGLPVAVLAPLVAVLVMAAFTVALLIDVRERR
jgi:hypothetical protein